MKSDRAFLADYSRGEGSALSNARCARWSWEGGGEMGSWRSSIRLVPVLNNIHLNQGDNSWHCVQLTVRMRRSSSNESSFLSATRRARFCNRIRNSWRCLTVTTMPEIQRYDLIGAMATVKTYTCVRADSLRKSMAYKSVEFGRVSRIDCQILSYS
jgi:hypothetical protein